MPSKRGTAPISDTVVAAVAKLVDDARSDTREPSHWDIEQRIVSAGLRHTDPHLDSTGTKVGKRKRLQAVLNWAVEHDEAKGEKLIIQLLALLRSVGGFRVESPSFVGEEALRNAQAAFKAEGFNLDDNGELLQELLDALTGQALTEALTKYVRRAKRGARDAALVTGTGKDLVEATAAHVLVQRTGSYPEKANFPSLLAQAYTCLGLCIDTGSAASPQDRVDAALFQAAMAANGLRNKEGTGHGRPFLSTLTESQSRIAVEIMAVVAERMLVMMKESR